LIWSHGGARQSLRSTNRPQRLTYEQSLYPRRAKTNKMKKLVPQGANSAQPHHVDLHVGALIRTRRKALGISQSELADSLGLTFQQVQKYERGSNRVSSRRMASDFSGGAAAVPALNRSCSKNVDANRRSTP